MFTRLNGYHHLAMVRCLAVSGTDTGSQHYHRLTATTGYHHQRPGVIIDFQDQVLVRVDAATDLVVILAGTTHNDLGLSVQTHMAAEFEQVEVLFRIGFLMVEQVFEPAAEYLVLLAGCNDFMQEQLSPKAEVLKPSLPE